MRSPSCGECTDRSADPEPLWTPASVVSTISDHFNFDRDLNLLRGLVADLCLSERDKLPKSPISTTRMACCTRPSIPSEPKPEALTLTNATTASVETSKGTTKRQS